MRLLALLACLLAAAPAAAQTASTTTQDEGAFHAELRREGERLHDKCSTFDLKQIGGIVVKGTSARPIQGNLPPRLFPTDSGMLNSIGLENVGVDAFIRDKMPFLRNLGNIAIVLVEQYLDFACELGDDFIVMDRGAVKYRCSRDVLDPAEIGRQMAL